MTWNGLLRCCISLASLFIAATTYAYDEPVVNLGYTSFYDGSPPAGPGFYFQDYFQYYTAHRFNDNNGNELALPRTDVDVIANITQLIYLSHKRVFGANLGVSALVPWLVNAKMNDGLHNTVLKSENGPGDLFIGPALQFDPIMRKDGKGPRFVQRFELDVVVPIGRYSSMDAVQPSSHFWSLNPYWAFTLWTTPEWSTSMRLHYLWNAVNSSPNVSFGPTAYNSQAGQAVFADFATSYAITQKFTLGINGYAFDQFTDTRVNGVAVPGRKERVWAIGPGMVYSLSKNHFIFFNYYSEQGARNRTQGSNGILRFVAHF